MISTYAWGHRRGRQDKAIGKDIGKIGGGMDTGHWSKHLASHNLLLPGALEQDQDIIVPAKMGLGDVGKQVTHISGLWSL